MFISEIFYSLQGEGLYSGVPSIFIRTSGCNLRCHWCDTPYASWYPEGKHQTIAEIMATIEPYEVRHIVLTGGEPLVSKELPQLTKQLHKKGYHITIETAGTLPPTEIVCDLASLSPKLSHSAPSATTFPEWHRRHQERRYRPEVLKQWVTQYPYQFKFVVTKPKEIEEITTLLAPLENLDRDRIFLMPEGIDTKTLQERMQWLAPLCQQHDLRLGPRLHIELYGNQRGT